jgi:hypothetical protein
MGAEIAPFLYRYEAIMNLNKLVCAHCGQERGKHSAHSYNCPEDGGFSRSKRFKLVVRKISDDCHAVARLRDREIYEIEREIARNLIKQIESQLGLLDFSRDIHQAEVLDGINLIRAGYDL